ncbi:DUF6474 family protein [Nocardia rhizosphaerihabitans]|uniref:Uncharacterized protein n=1 Tax=Nocardia rhizosphaerihabitans TaxID=1691570 RepID=A0ABQ2KPM9_9NOCA|nr:DUF6474 family protein [Nocardia rhizosphaerihabitans]GGN88525.1 hypothetical protein GCM10011610_46050 [Nocardia rhizosphaerihabitans]
MGLFSKRKRRPSRRAEAKALKHKAAVEAKLGAKNERKAAKASERTNRRAAKAQAKTEAKVAKAQIATLHAEEKAAEKLAAKADRELFSAAQIRKYIGVARVLVPVLTPLAYRGATYLRGQLDARKAQQLGIGLDQLGEFSGHGARLQARITNTETALNKVAADAPGDADTKKFVDAARSRLTDLTVAVNTAEQMPAARRKAVHASISAELSVLETDALARLGVR